MNAFVASDETVSATHLQIRITLQTNRFIAGNQHFLALEMNAFHAGDEHFSAGDERVENACSSFSHTHTHTQLATYDFQAECQDYCFSNRYLPPKRALSR